MNVLRTIVLAYAYVVLARVILEWIPVSYDHPLARVRSVLRAVTDPLLTPLRSIIPPVRMGGMALDLSPMILMIVLFLLAGAL
ncbi:MAG TPA: YggT family protein [Acidimicrobiia bacterium]